MFELTFRGSCVALATTALACTSGTGSGEMESTTAAGKAATEEQVEFAWNSDGISTTTGEIKAEVPKEGDFRGKYMEVTSETQVEGVGPYFDGYWDDDWDAWDGWGGDPDAFVTHYSGKVIAVLKNEKGESMRCRFRLAVPSKGPAGGGYGECQEDKGEEIKNVVLKDK